MKAWLTSSVSFGVWLATCLVIGLLLAGGVVLYTNARLDAQEAKNAAVRARNDAVRQREGRAIAIDFLCGGLSGVEAAGKKALRGELPGQHGQGLPDSAIAEYNATISRRIILQAGVGPRGILDEQTGRIDCDALGQAAKAHP